jgi:hypothetical protein
VTTEDVRVKLLDACDRAYRSASARGSQKGILRAQQLIADADPEHDTYLWMARLLDALAALRAATADDDNGFVLGGIATVRLLVEEERTWMGYIPEE